jgi:DNA-binding transcriptional ArsR family regulator
MRAYGNPLPSERLAPEAPATLATVNDEDALAMLKYIRDHDGATAQTIAGDVLGAPRTTFGRPLRVRRATAELQTLVKHGLLTESQSGRRRIYLLTEAGRKTLRDAALGAGLSGLDHPRL